MSGVNKIILIGRLGREPEVKFTKDGKAVCNFSLAVTDRKGQEAEWFNIVAWEKLAELCGEYLNKGSQIYVEGRQKTETWDNDGEKKYKQIIIIYNMTMLGQSNSNEQSVGGQGERGDNPANEFESDDIPF